MFKNESGQIRAGWIVLLAVVALLIVQQLFSLPGVILLIFTEAPSLVNGETGTADIVAALDAHPWIFLLVQGGGSVGGILITYLLWRFINKGTMKQLGFRGSLKDLWFGLFLGAISITVIFIVLMATGNVTLMNPLSSPQFSVFTISFSNFVYPSWFL